MTNFEKWVKAMVRQYKKDNNVLIRLFGSKTYVAYNFKTQETSIARCHPKDTFAVDIGQAIAYARCKGYKIPKQIVYKKLSEMKNGENFVDVVGDTYRYVAKDEGVFVVWWYEHNKYCGMPFDVEYEMVD